MTRCTDVSEEPALTRRVMMEVTSSSEILSHFFQTTRRRVPEGSHLYGNYVRTANHAREIIYKG